VLTVLNNLAASRFKQKSIDDILKNEVDANCFAYSGSELCCNIENMEFVILMRGILMSETSSPIKYILMKWSTDHVLIFSYMRDLDCSS
jgi:hypothetical protein